MKTSLASLTLITCLIAARPAAATIDEVLQATIIYEHPQVGGYCYASVPVSAEIGIPSAALIEATLVPTWVYRAGSGGGGEATWIGGLRYVNLNAVAAGARIKHTYKADSYLSSGVLEYRGELDVTALAQKNGTSLEGRQATVRQAKMALLAIARDVARVSMDGRYRLFLTYKGLPSQSGLSGRTLPLSTVWPYTASSALLLDIEREIIAAHGCPAASSKADSLGAASSLEDEAAAGCAAAGPAAGVSLLGLLMLLASGLLLVRRRR